MRFERKYQPWLACSKEKNRPALTHVNLTIIEVSGERVGFLDATNSYVMVRVPVIELHPDDTPGLVLVTALKHAAKTGSTKHESADIGCIPGRCETPDGYAWPRPDGAFPDFDKIGKDAKKNTVTTEIGVNGEFLALVQKAMGGRNAALKISTPLKPIIVTTGHESNAAKALVMPVRIHS